MKPNLIPLFLVTALILLAVVSAVQPGYASHAAQGSPTINLILRVNPAGDNVLETIQGAAQNGIDLLAVDFSWREIWPEQNGPLQAGAFEQVMAQAQVHDLKVLVSITDAPPWAMTAHGPDAAQTAGLAAVLTQAYPSITAVELFPGANTVAGWGAVPDSRAYLVLLHAVGITLEANPAPVTMVAGGFTPISDSLDVEETQYLNMLYADGAKPLLRVVSIRYPAGTDLLSTETREMRYEALRMVMLNQQHAEAALWLTGFSWPEGTTIDEQTAWLSNAFQRLNSQLYVEAAVVSALDSRRASALFDPKGQPHPAFPAALRIIHPASYTKNALDVIANSPHNNTP